jgi:hypothetical protein
MMRLHRYFGSHADTTLRDKRLLLAKVSDFNDPFEFAHRFSGDYTVDYAEKDQEYMSDEEVQAMLSTIEPFQEPGYFKETTPRRRLAEFFVRMGGRPPVDVCHGHKLADEFFRVCCFSKTDVTSDSEILLWSHYANSHRGVRIEFEFDEHRFPLAEVAYSLHRCAIEFSRAYEGDHTNEILRQAMHTKSTAWSYEKEVRLILKKDSLPPSAPGDGERVFLPFDTICVKSVDFGINCDDATVESVSSVLRTNFPDVPIRKAFHHPEDYAIEYRSPE